MLFEYPLRSQVVQLVIERSDIAAVLLDDVLLLIRVLVFPTLVATGSTLCHSDCHVEVGDLVGILARSWNLNWTSPVVVEVAEGVG